MPFYYFASLPFSHSNYFGCLITFPFSHFPISYLPIFPFRQFPMCPFSHFPIFPSAQISHLTVLLDIAFCCSANFLFFHNPFSHFSKIPYIYTSRYLYLLFANLLMSHFPIVPSPHFPTSPLSRFPITHFAVLPFFYFSNFKFCHFAILPFCRFAQIFGGAMHHHYDPPEGFRWDIATVDAPIQARGAKIRQKSRFNTILKYFRHR